MWTGIGNGNGLAYAKFSTKWRSVYTIYTTFNSQFILAIFEFIEELFANRLELLSYACVRWRHRRLKWLNATITGIELVLLSPVSYSVRLEWEKVEEVNRIFLANVYFVHL